MPLFDIPTRTSKDTDLEIARKSNTKTKSATTKNSGILALMQTTISEVNEKLGKYKDSYCIIRTIDEFNSFIDKANENGIISIDTETTGKDAMKDKLVGVCLYTPDTKACYIPVNHVSYITGERLDNQLSEQDINSCLSRLNKDTKIIMFNAQFDIKVLVNNCDIRLKCYWDCYLGARLLNENEKENALKKLHQKYVLKNEEDEYKFAELFDDATMFMRTPVETAYLYAAHDPIITYEYYEFQRKFLNEDAREDLRQLYYCMINSEMPVLDAVITMELTGVELDTNYAKELSVKYSELYKSKLSEINEELDKYKDVIDTYRAKNPNVKIDEPINVLSSSQLSIFLYDILKLEPVDKDTPRGTGEEILKKIDLKLCKLILELRGHKKMLSTYIDKLPNEINEKTGRIHCKFNQYGADTGRFSSTSPNLQNIPSHNIDIRKMFKATDGYVMMSSDYSQQEPKCLAALCKLDGDSQMYDTFMQGKDLYSEIASKSFHKPYEECIEFNADGTTNKEGKDRRSKAKSILLGVLYGRGEDSIAEQLKCSVDEAKDIKQSVFNGFPAIKKFEEDTLNMARNRGYVTTILGRKRRLPDMQLPQYEFKSMSKTQDVLDFDELEEQEVPDSIKRKYLSKLETARFGHKKAIFQQANAEGYWIIDNSQKISSATRKCVNARIQGSAADLTKAAMIELDTNKRAKEIGLRMLIPVHDELIVECPEVYAKEGKELLAKLMSEAAEKILKMPIKCDVAVSKCWYGEELNI